MITQIRIFALPMPKDNFYQTLLGLIIKPLINEFKTDLNWFWFSRYWLGKDRYGVWIDIGDCDFEKIDAKFKAPLQGETSPCHRSVRFRINIKDEAFPKFEARVKALTAQWNYGISGFLPYDYIADTANSRMLGVENPDTETKKRRAEIVTNYYHSIAKFMLDSLVKLEGKNEYQFEHNHYWGNEVEPYTRLLHMFRNITYHHEP
jgi:hypothetical protein